MTIAFTSVVSHPDLWTSGPGIDSCARHVIRTRTGGELLHLWGGVMRLWWRWWLSTLRTRNRTDVLSQTTRLARCCFIMFMYLIAQSWYCHLIVYELYGIILGGRPYRNALFCDSCVIASGLFWLVACIRSHWVGIVWGSLWDRYGIGSCSGGLVAHAGSSAGAWRYLSSRNGNSVQVWEESSVWCKALVCGGGKLRPFRVARQSTWWVGTELVTQTGRWSCSIVQRQFPTMCPVKG